MSKWGDVVIVEIPYDDRPGAEERPVVVVPCDRNNARLLSTLVTGVTTNLRHVTTEPTQFLVDPVTPDSRSSGLSQPSAVKCENIYTVSQERIKRTLGHLSDALRQQLDACLKAATTS